MKKRQRIQAWHDRQRSLASIHAVDFASPFHYILRPQSQQISCQPARHYRIARGGNARDHPRRSNIYPGSQERVTEGLQ
jgi:hypothetical protein